MHSVCTTLIFTGNQLFREIHELQILLELTNKFPLTRRDRQSANSSEFCKTDLSDKPGKIYAKE